MSSQVRILLSPPNWHKKFIFNAVVVRIWEQRFEILNWNNIAGVAQLVPARTERYVRAGSVRRLGFLTKLSASLEY
ncbi:hypothetical protein [Ulvibacterium marinum]|uniref:Uncharacterized protein n=1 Tax=Ulvibacterium marinum TaxID=2419782 RepID=A0A3B0BXV6_9FLAO|nr:hypothetical protein [Ulvibacterium marinum]RKN78335.1 hypothetical protein D7Z94_19090 [Ulvibacterium marinum]